MFDGHLDAIRAAIDELLEMDEVMGTDQLQLIIDGFDAGPLTLQQLSRIAICLAVGGADFKRRVLELNGHLPPLLLKYVADPTELMLDDTQLLRLTRH